MCPFDPPNEPDLRESRVGGRPLSTGVGAQSTVPDCAIKITLINKKPQYRLIAVLGERSCLRYDFFTSRPREPNLSIGKWRRASRERGYNPHSKRAPPVACPQNEPSGQTDIPSERLDPVS